MAENSRKNEFFERESIAIIAILAAMLMPALQKARGTAQSSKCLSNIRQIGGGIIQYGLDHKDLLFPATIAPVGTANAKYNNGLTYVGIGNDCWSRLAAPYFGYTELTPPPNGHPPNYMVPAAKQGGLIKCPAMLTLCNPRPARLLCSWHSPSKKTGVDSHSLLQWIFPTPGLNPGLLHCRQILDHLSHQGSQKSLRKPLYSVHLVLREYTTRDLHKTADHKTTTDYDICVRM